MTMPGAGLISPKYSLSLLKWEARTTRLNGSSWEVGVSHPMPFVYVSPIESLATLNKKREVDI